MAENQAMEAFILSMAPSAYPINNNPVMYTNTPKNNRMLRLLNSYLNFGLLMTMANDSEEEFNFRVNLKMSNQLSLRIALRVRVLPVRVSQTWHSRALAKACQRSRPAGSRSDNVRRARTSGILTCTLYLYIPGYTELY